MSSGIVSITPQQFRALVEDKLDGAGPCRVSDALPAAEIAATAVVPNARVLMAELDGGARLTARGNLSRALVKVVMDRTRWPDIDANDYRRVSKVINEDDFAPALYLHAILKLAGLARVERGVLKLTKKGRSLLAEEATGSLQALLFRTTFARYNLAYLDRYDLPEFFAPQISLILYLIGRFCDDWRAAGSLMRSVALPSDAAKQARYPEMVDSAFGVRVLRYLEWFGLIEHKDAAANDDWRRRWLYRKTPLYDRMLSFSVAKA